MLLLIDGHNLISALPDITLDDPNDEAKLVEKLKSYAARTGNRCVVVFDGGIPGGLSRDLSSGRVRAVFAAAARTNADRVLRERIREAPDPGRHALYSRVYEEVYRHLFPAVRPYLDRLAELTQDERNNHERPTACDPTAVRVSDQPARPGDPGPAA
jgi:hypothetical protein